MALSVASLLDPTTMWFVIKVWRGKGQVRRREPLEGAGNQTGASRSSSMRDRGFVDKMD